jgi:hypothetical protein
VSVERPTGRPLNGERAEILSVQASLGIPHSIGAKRLIRQTGTVDMGARPRPRGLAPGGSDLA